MPTIRWPQVIAASLVIVGAAGVALMVHSFEPKPLSENQMAASKRKFLANCGEGMFDVSPQSVVCPTFDAIAFESWPCTGCDAYVLTLRADGMATLQEGVPVAGVSPTLEADVGQGEFRRLANLVAAMQFDRLGGYVEPPLHSANEVIKAGCGGAWSFRINQGGSEGEAAAVARCFHAVKQRADWSQR